MDNNDVAEHYEFNLVIISHITEAFYAHKIIYILKNSIRRSKASLLNSRT